MKMGLAIVGTSAAMVFGGCSSEGDPADNAAQETTRTTALESVGELDLTVNPALTTDLALFVDEEMTTPNNLQGYAGFLKAGEVVTALCRATSEEVGDLQIVLAQNADNETGFTALLHMEGSKDETPQQIFTLDPEAILARLPNCDAVTPKILP
ncbi:MAG TPA: hypothetical protein VK674_03925 [Candidatus Limnocylindria bacterium]|nr:hypothetical protein [Candidatus Limnocylindria bacterium]